MTNGEIKKSESLKLGKVIEYANNSVIIKSIIRKSTGNVSIYSLDTGEEIVERVSPFDTFIQIIEGDAEVIIDGKSNLLNTNESIIIPAHSINKIVANGRFKMLKTIIKCGYE